VLLRCGRQAPADNRGVLLRSSTAGPPREPPSARSPLPRAGNHCSKHARLSNPGSPSPQHGRTPASTSGDGAPRLAGMPPQWKSCMGTTPPTAPMPAPPQHPPRDSLEHPHHHPGAGGQRPGDSRQRGQPCCTAPCLRQQGGGTRGSPTLSRGQPQHLVGRAPSRCKNPSPLQQHPSLPTAPGHPDLQCPCAPHPTAAHPRGAQPDVDSSCQGPALTAGRPSLRRHA